MFVTEKVFCKFYWDISLAGTISESKKERTINK